VVFLVAVLLIAGARSERNEVPRRLQTVDPEHAVRTTILAIEDARTLTPSELKTLTDLIRSSPDHRLLAVRALGRIERRDAAPLLVEALRMPGLRDEAAAALMLVLRANAAQTAPAGDLASALEALIADAPPPVLARLPYTRPDQIQQAEARLLSMIDAGRPYRPYATVARAVETLVRLNRKLWRPSDETLEVLRRIARGDMPLMPRTDWVPPLNGMAALMAVGDVTGDMMATVLDNPEPQVRRLAALALYGGASDLDAARRTDLVRKALADSSPLVRYEGLRAWARRETAAHGCGPLLDARSDTSMHVALAAIDMLGERCREDETVTDRLAEDARTPPSSPDWHREGHALVALAKRAPDRAASHLQVFRLHTVWQVRMYAARAAGHMKDLMTLERLAYDEHDNVREAALPALHALKADPNDPAMLAALRRTDYQLLLTVANLLKGTAPNKPIVLAIIDALKRVTADRKDTSRDIRLALIERIREFAGAEQARVLEPYARDFDPRVAQAAAAAYHALTGRTVAVTPKPLSRPAPPTQEELEERLVARFELETGGGFDVTFDKASAPLAYARFARLVREKYYDGLTFHRVVPNFVIQGGSPGANEYVGHGPFMRDELGAAWHARGTLGISTRGRDTGDAQIFINLVDNSRLDFEYTVFARVKEEHMDAVDSIQEGARILRVRLLPQRR
jgi:cyclophilin family peptidyl-prolyl cis-trans isomerase